MTALRVVEVADCPALGANDRPKSAMYVPKQCREYRPGAGGSPLPTSPLVSRPLSARSGTSALQLKTERWREAGTKRWPRPTTSGHIDEQDSTPFNQFLEYSQGNWKNECWMRSLRKPGLPIQDPVYSVPGGNMEDLHEEWQSCPVVSSRTVPYSGCTASGKAALPAEIRPARWVEKPVATGKYSLKHMGGQRYKWDEKTPRFYQDEASPHFIGDPDKSKILQATPKEKRQDGSRGRRPGARRWRVKPVPADAALHLDLRELF